MEFNNTAHIVQSTAELLSVALKSGPEIGPEIALKMDLKIHPEIAPKSGPRQKNAPDEHENHAKRLSCSPLAP